MGRPPGGMTAAEIRATKNRVKYVASKAMAGIPTMSDDAAIAWALNCPEAGDLAEYEAAVAAMKAHKLGQHAGRISADRKRFADSSYVDSIDDLTNSGDNSENESRGVG